MCGDENNSTVEHIPVLAKTLTEQIKLPREAVMVDTTIGQGGHSSLFGTRMGPDGTIIGLDIDKNAIHRAQLKLKDLPCKVILINSNFAFVHQQVRKLGIEKVDFILADLGVCSAQLTDDQIGISFQKNMPLDMRFDKSITTTAADIINDTDEKSLADLIFRFGEDRASRRIARFIVEFRQRQRITTTGQLAAIVSKAIGRPGKTKIHPATRTFQALRIAVNDELGNLQKLLDAAPDLLKENGKIAIISFHSLEDRIVKNNFKQNEAKDIYKLITKKPIVPPREEININRRARSAKLRIAEKINN
jgi:16S rRNA (cytosine1402-N4)-methyltransferase